MSEVEFTLEVLHLSQAKLLLDVNNIFVNSHNHALDSRSMIRAFAACEIAYCHIAGHTQNKDGIFIDTHGSAISEEVWNLLEYLGSLRPLPPVLVERDNHIPENPEEILDEVRRARSLVEKSRNKILTNKEPNSKQKILWKHETETKGFYPFKIYRELGLNNIRSLLRKALPQTVEKIGKNFDTVSEQFFIRKKITSRFFRDVPQFFTKYLQHKKNRNAELAHYESSRFALQAAPRFKKNKKVSSQTLLRHTRFYFNPARALTKQHRAFILLVRHPENDKIHEYKIHKKFYLALKKFEGEEKISFRKLRQLLPHFNDEEMVAFLKFTLSSCAFIVD